MAAGEPADPHPTATLGELTFDLDAGELRRRAEALLERAQRSLDAIVAAAGPRTVASVLEPLNGLLTEVWDVGSHGSLMFSVHTQAATRTAGREASEAADRFVHGFCLNEGAYAALKALDLSGQDAGTRFAVEKLLREMRREGVEKDPAVRERLLAVNRQIDIVANRFSENIANLERAIDLDSPEELEGLPPDFVASHPDDESGKVRITTRYPDFGPVMAYADRGEVRRRLLYEFANRAYPANTPVLAELLALRGEFARILGYPTFAAYATEDKMVRVPEAVQKLLDRLHKLLAGPARADLDRFLARKRRDDPTATKLEPWEAQFYGPGYYDQKIRSEEFGVDMRLLRSYLPYGQVRDGLFALCRELFGIEFSKVAAEAWHPTVEVYDVARHREPLGRIYLDLAPREGKFNHAACFTVRHGVAGVQLPQSALICNFLDPGCPAEVARLEHGEVITFFHEFGHLLHALLAGHQRWVYNGQSKLEWDFIEAPSQLFEEWARDPATLSRFAMDPDTGEAVPADLLARLKASASLGRALMWLRQVALAAVSLDLHTRDLHGKDLSDATRAAYARYAPEPLRGDYHFEAAFGHLAGYSACYYTYAWSAVIARDLLSPFFARGTLTDPETADRYAREILMPGSERPAAELIRAYLGREFSFDEFENWVTEPARVPGPRPGPTPANRSPSRRSKPRSAKKRG
jgi:thimet oligopeptidase